MKISAGTLLYRWRMEEMEVLLVHPSGNYNRRAPWSIPKGLVDKGETPVETAVRETLEETGVSAADLFELGSIEYTKSRKRVFCFGGLAPSTEPRCASWEVDQAEFLRLETAKQKIHLDQLPFLNRLCEHLGYDQT